MIKKGHRLDMQAMGTWDVRLFTERLLDNGFLERFKRFIDEIPGEMIRLDGEMMLTKNSINLLSQIEDDVAAATLFFDLARGSGMIQFVPEIIENEITGFTLRFTDLIEHYFTLNATEQYLFLLECYLRDALIHRGGEVSRIDFGMLVDLLVRGYYHRSDVYGVANIFGQNGIFFKDLDTFGIVRYRGEVFDLIEGLTTPRRLFLAHISIFAMGIFSGDRQVFQRGGFGIAMARGFEEPFQRTLGDAFAEARGKITLEIYDIKERVKLDLVVAGEDTLAVVQRAIQDLLNYHSNRDFTFYNNALTPFGSSVRGIGGEPGIADRIKLRELGLYAGKVIYYEYDTKEPWYLALVVKEV